MPAKRKESDRAPPKKPPVAKKSRVRTEASDQKDDAADTGGAAGCLSFDLAVLDRDAMLSVVQKAAANELLRQHAASKGASPWVAGDTIEFKGGGYTNFFTVSDAERKAGHSLSLSGCWSTLLTTPTAGVGSNMSRMIKIESSLLAERWNEWVKEGKDNFSILYVGDKLIASERFDPNDVDSHVPIAARGKWTTRSVDGLALLLTDFKPCSEEDRFTEHMCRTVIQRGGVPRSAAEAETALSKFFAK